MVHPIPHSARMKTAVLIYSVWTASSVVAMSYEPYYKEGFMSHVEKLHASQERSLVMRLFRGLDASNHSDLCTEQLSFFRQSVFKQQQQWAVSMLDSCASPGPGWLSGNTISLGDFDGCFASTPPKNLSTSYCLVTQELPSQRTKMDLPWAPHDVAVMSSLCLPESCNEGRLKSLLKVTEGVGNVTVQCQSNRRKPFSSAELLAVCFFLLICATILSAFIPRKWIPIKSKGLIACWDSFDLRQNLSGLMTTSNRGELLSCLDSIRFFSQCLIIVYHSLRNEMFAFHPVLNKFYFYEFFRTWPGALYVQYVLSVDTFFLLNGVLLTWNLLEKRKNIGIFKYYFQRYLRLTPTHMAVVLYEATLYGRLCNGPMCWSTTEQEKNKCSKYWWANALYISNFYPGVVESCVPQAWYLSAEWQLFFFVSPFVVLLVRRGTRHASIFIVGVLIASIMSTFALSYSFRLPTENLSFASVEEAKHYYDFLYSTPFPRAGPWAIGMLFGIFLHIKKDSFKLSKSTLLVGWILAGAGFYLSLGMILPLQEHVAAGSRGTFWNSFYNAFQGNVWVASICWIIFCCGTQRAGPFGSFLCWKGFQPLGKLSYCAYLVHMGVLLLYYGEARVSSYVSLTTQVPLLIGLICISYGVALILHLAFEAPTERLNRLIFSKAVRKSSTIERRLSSNRVEPKKTQETMTSGQTAIRLVTVKESSNTKLPTEINK